VASIALFAAVGGVAVASIGSSGAVVHACYQRQGGDLRVIDTAKLGFAGKCRATEKALSWNEQGPKGLPGATGTRGPAGSALGWAHVLADGRVDSGHNVTTANVTHPFATGYCFIGLGFVPHAAVASLDGFNFTAGSTDQVQVQIGGNFPANNCPTGVQVEVHVQNAGGTAAPFSIIFQ
jgi:hypothetical protein